MTDDSLPTRELLFRSTLNPQMSTAEEEEAVASWLERQPEARPGHVAVVKGQLLVAREALVKARDAAELLGWDGRAHHLTEMLRTLGDMERAVVGEVGG